MRLYPDFAFANEADCDINQMMKMEATVYMHFSMTTPGNTVLLIDQSGKNNHANKTNNAATDPTWMPSNKGLSFSPGKFLKLPEIP